MTSDAGQSSLWEGGDDVDVKQTIWSQGDAVNVYLLLLELNLMNGMCVGLLEHVWNLAPVCLSVKALVPPPQCPPSHTYSGQNTQNTLPFNAQTAALQQLEG